MAKTKEKKENKVMKGIDAVNPANLGEKMADKLVSLFT